MVNSGQLSMLERGCCSPFLALKWLHALLRAQERLDTTEQGAAPGVSPVIAQLLVHKCAKHDQRPPCQGTQGTAHATQVESSKCCISGVGEA